MALHSIEHHEHYSLAIWKMEESAELLSSLLDAALPSVTTSCPHMTCPHIVCPHIVCPHTAEKRRQEFYACRLAALQLGINPLSIEKHPDGHPVLNDGSGFISFSHSRDFAAVLFSSQKDHIGIDIETASPRLLKAAQKYMNGKELAHIEAFFPDEKATIEALTLYWCIKEALFKAVQSGKIDFQQSFQIELVETVKAEGSLKASYKDSHFRLDYRFDGESMLCVCMED